MPPLLSLLLQAQPFTRSEIISMMVAGLGLLYFIINRVNVVRDRVAAKREALREQATKERTEKLKRHEAFMAEQQTKNTNFQQQIEHCLDEMNRLKGLVEQSLSDGRENKQKVENVKETLARIESQLTTLLGTLLNRP